MRRQSHSFMSTLKVLLGLDTAFFEKNEHIGSEELCYGHASITGR